MNEIIKYIFLFLIGTTILNLLIAVTARIKTGYKEYNILVLYWFFIFITYFTVASLNNSPTEIAFAYFFQTFSSFLFVKMLCDSRGVKTRYKIYLPLHMIGMIISAWMLLKTDLGFTRSLIPITFTMTLPFWEPIWNTLVSHRKESNWIEKMMGIIFITGIINHFNYAFFRLDPDNAWWGWSVSIAQYQCLSIFLPLLINHRRAMNERKNIEMAIRQLSGEQKDYDLEMNDLYRSLENVIIQREKLTQELRKTNSSLEEEREMNEMLIKTVSHDLANPITVIKSYLEMIESGRTPANQATLEKIKMNALSALDMISRIRTAILTRSQSSLINPESVPVMKCLKASLDFFDAKLKDKELSINLRNHTNQEMYVLAEEKSLSEHIFANVLSNAIKFSHRKSAIDIDIRDNKQYVEVTFKDYGIGLTNERLDKLFGMPTEGTEGENGTGLGLVLMGYFLRSFGAKYEIKSSGPGQGATVILNFKKS